MTALPNHHVMCVHAMAADGKTEHSSIAKHCGSIEG